MSCQVVPRLCESYREFTQHRANPLAQPCGRILSYEGYLFRSDNLIEGECLVSVDGLRVRVGQLALILDGNLLLVLTPHCLTLGVMVRPPVVSGRLHGSPLLQKIV